MEVNGYISRKSKSAIYTSLPSSLPGANSLRVNFILKALYSREANSKPPGRVAQLVGHLTRKSGVLGSIPGLATYFRFSFRFFKKGSCQLLAKVCAQSTG